jgi:hypothetical protein
MFVTYFFPADELKSIDAFANTLHVVDGSTASTSSNVSSICDGLKNTFGKLRRKKNNNKRKNNRILRHRDSFELNRGGSSDFIPRQEFPY